VTPRGTGVGSQAPDPLRRGSWARPGSPAAYQAPLARANAIPPEIA
jgi:hypothetical protein